MLAFGFDEETRGVRGAVKIAEVLEKAWGRNGFALVLDEGGMALTTVGDLRLRSSGCCAERVYGRAAHPRDLRWPPLATTRA